MEVSTLIRPGRSLGKKGRTVLGESMTTTTSGMTMPKGSRVVLKSSARTRGD